MKKPIILTAALLIAAVSVSGCGSNNGTQNSGGSTESRVVLDFTKAESSVPLEESSIAEASDEPTESSADESSIEESSAEPSVPEESFEPEPDDTETTALERYAEKMEKEGSIELNSVGLPEGAAAGWKVDHYKIDDYNNDGHKELVIQYNCWVDITNSNYQSHNDHQGIALKLVTVEDNALKEYQNSSFDQYIRLAGAGIGTDAETTEELVVDEQGRLGILTTQFRASDSVRLTVNTKVLEKGELKNQGGFAISKMERSGHYGNGREPQDAPYWFFVSEDNTFDCLFLFYDCTDVNKSYGDYIGLAETKRRMNAAQALKKADDFAVTSGSLSVKLMSEFKEDLDSDFYIAREDE